MNKWCDKCGCEIVRQGDLCTWYEGKKVCECKETKTNKVGSECKSEKIRSVNADCGVCEVCENCMYCEMIFDEKVEK